MNRFQPCIWFNNQAEEAVNYYISAFGSGKIKKTAHYGETGSQVSGQSKGSVLTVEFDLYSWTFVALNGGPHFKPSQGVSFFVQCETVGEVDHLWKKLSKGGVIWELKKYPWAEKYGWCEDQFGVSWQIMLTGRKDISPCFLFTNKVLGKAEQAMKFYTE